MTAQDDRAEPLENAPSLCVIVRVTEHPVPLDEFYREYAPALRSLNRDLTFVFVVEPWARRLAIPAEALAEAGEPVRVIETTRGLGEANLLRHAAERCAGDVILTLPAYHRVEAAALPALVREIDRGADLAVARRWPRTDGWWNRFQSRVFNSILRRLVGHTTSDVACGVEAMRRRVLEETPLYGDSFRFLPVLAVRAGFRVSEVDAPQHAEDRRTRIHGPGTYVRRLIDILGLFFLVRFTEKPLRFFGIVGGTLSVGGGALLMVLFFQRAFAGVALANRPILLVGIIALTLGAQAIALGLIGEMIVHLHATPVRRYRVLDSDDAP